MELGESLLQERVTQRDWELQLTLLMWRTLIALWRTDAFTQTAENNTQQAPRDPDEAPTAKHLSNQDAVL